MATSGCVQAWLGFYGRRVVGGAAGFKVGEWGCWGGEAGRRGARGSEGNAPPPMMLTLRLLWVAPPRGANHYWVAGWLLCSVMLLFLLAPSSYSPLHYHHHHSTTPHPLPHTPRNPQ